MLPLIQREKDILCNKKIKEHKLNMNLTDVEFKFDNSKILFYFTADGRIDFRELVKDLAAIYKTRIELRQIGVRDEVKRIGGNGVCGRELCCCSFLSDFEAVSIKMAKEHDAMINNSVDLTNEYMKHQLEIKYPKLSMEIQQIQNSMEMIKCQELNLQLDELKMDEEELS